MRPPREKPHRLDEHRYAGRISVYCTLCVENRRPLFSDPKTVDVFREKLFHHCRNRESTATVYCFMPDHLHVIVFGQSDEALPKKAIDGFKTSTGIWLKQQASESVWQTGYYDRIIRDHAEWSNTVRYILQNPVRAGLVESFEDYPFLGSQSFTWEDLLGNLG